MCIHICSWIPCLSPFTTAWGLKTHVVNLQAFESDVVLAHFDTPALHCLLEGELSGMISGDKNPQDVMVCLVWGVG